MNLQKLLFICLVIAVGVGAGSAGIVHANSGDSLSQSQDAETTTTEEEIVQVTTEYPTDESNQAIGVTVQIAPEQETVTDVEIDIRQSEESFIDHDSYGISVEPSGAAEINEELQDAGTHHIKSYEISELEPGENVEIRFEAYPRQLTADDEMIDAASVQYEFRRGGVSVPDAGIASIDAETDISGSPVYQLLDLRTQVNSLETQVEELEADDDEVVEDDDSVLPWIMFGVGVLGLLAGVGGIVYTRRNGTSDPPITEYDLQRYKSDIEDLSQNAERYGNERTADQAAEIAKQLEDELDDR